MYDPPPALDAIRVVLRDLGVDARFEHADDEYVWLRVAGGDRLAVWTAGEEHDDLVSIADRIQNDISETAAYWSQALPPCPGHAHPATPTYLDDEAWWTCPVSGQRLARIGELAGDHDPEPPGRGRTERAKPGLRGP